ncbi:MAG: class I SAM-dependent methyltransferase [Streptosporangiaceae bacterium]
MGSSIVQGRYWGMRASDWAEFQEACVKECYLDVIELFAPLDGVRLLDVGCAAGVFAKLASERGATVAGIDASSELLEIAVKQAPGVDFRVGEMEELPYPDDSFDIATGFNAFQYASDPVNALREAARVVKPGGKVVRMTWGRPDQVEAVAYVRALGATLPPPEPGKPNSFALAEPGALEDVMAKAGMEPGERHEVACPWIYADYDAAIRGLLASGQATKAIEYSGLDAVTAAISQGLEPFRQDDGSYVMRNVFHYVAATVV